MKRIKQRWTKFRDEWTYEIVITHPEQPPRTVRVWTLWGARRQLGRFLSKHGPTVTVEFIREGEN